jgi:5-methylcytosine-specific restriction endonuclease McrA
MKIERALRLTASELIAQVAQLARGERAATVALIVHLGEFDARRLFAAFGFSSTFKYCVEVLRLSEDAAVSRIRAARMAREYPVVVDMLLEGALSPTTACMLSRHVTADNHAALLAAASGQSKHEVEKVLAGLFPQAERPDAVRPIGSPEEMATPAATSTGFIPQISAPVPAEVAVGSSSPVSDNSAYAGAGAGGGLRPPVAAAPAVPPLARPISAQRYEIRFTASAETHDLLRRAQDLLGHAVPRGDLGQVFDRALALLVADLERKTFGATSRPQKGRGRSGDSRHIPAAVRRAVSNRDRGRCAFLGSGGRRCDARRFLEFHHVKPFAVGGKATVDNIQLRCRAHNRYEADVFYGPMRRDGDSNPPVPERVDMEWTRSSPRNEGASPR